MARQPPLSLGILLQGIFPTQGWNLWLLRLLHCRRIVCCRATREAPITLFALPKLQYYHLTRLRYHSSQAKIQGVCLNRGLKRQSTYRNAFIHSVSHICMGFFPPLLSSPFYTSKAFFNKSLAGLILSWPLLLGGLGLLQ